MILLNNLVSNALRYADRDKPDSYMRISAELTPQNATITFSDNGIGIEQQHLRKIFDMFYRADYNAKGSGLGLFIFRETIRRLGGNVRVESIATAGTTFIFSIPNLFVGSQPKEESDRYSNVTSK